MQTLIMWERINIPRFTKIRITKFHSYELYNEAPTLGLTYHPKSLLNKNVDVRTKQNRTEYRAISSARCISCKSCCCSSFNNHAIYRLVIVAGEIKLSA
jgi:hypothetical protein